MAKNILNLAADFSRQLASSVSIGDTTCSLNSNLDNDGVALQNQRLYGFTVDRGASKEYIVGLHNNGTLTQIVSISRQGASTSGFSKAHRIGTPMEITDWASLYRITSVLNGDIDLDSGTPLKYDGAPSQAEANALATVQFVLDTASGSTVLAFNPLTISGVAGENIAEGDWIYLDESDGQWYKTDADDTAKSVDVKIGKSRGTANAEEGIPGGIFVFGSETAGTYTTGQSYYLSNTPGELSTTPGTNEVLVGVGDDNENLVFNHIYPRELSTNTQAALAGGGDFGTPSASNKFVTEEFLETFNEPTVQVYTSNATWNKPAGLKYVVVEMVGGGGGGGADNGSNTAGAGGGGGGYCRKKINANDLGSTENVVVGVGGSSVNNSAGLSGGTSSFGSHCNATGGQGGGGGGAVVAGTIGGVGNNGDINTRGSSGDSGVALSPPSIGGRGGDSFFGGGASNKIGFSGADSGNPGQNYGGGGGGYFRVSSSATLAGGSGANGIVIVTEYYV